MWLIIKFYNKIIARLSSLPKILEEMLVPKFVTIFNKVISDKQHDFCHTKSTTTNLLVYYTDLVSIIGKGIQVDAVYTDIRKASDSVIDLSILVKELEYNGIFGNLLNWLKTYLISRTQ